MKYLRVLLFSFLLIFVGRVANPTYAQTDAPLALVMTANGPVMPPMLEYFKRGIATAENRNAEILIIELNTPGGSVSTMLEMVQIMRDSQVPIVVYVAPNDAIAGSAGALITMAGHASAMTPSAAIGAASPIDSSGNDIQSTLKSKINEMLKAKARGLVERRGASAVKLAEAMIDSAKAVTAKEARGVKLIDFISKDTNALLEQLNGFSVTTKDDTRKLNTQHIVVEALPMNLIESLLLTLTDPNIVFLLLSIGTMAILIEMSSPGGWAAGFIGAVCLALAIYGMGVLPINGFGAIFFIIAFVLFILDIKAPTHGALTLAGVGSFIVGALVLFNSPGTPQFQRVSIPLVIGMGVFIGAIFFAALIFVVRAQRGRIQTGAEALVGKTGIAKSFGGNAGQIQVGSELWSAEKSPESEKIHKGDSIEVVEVKGLRLIVKKRDSHL